MADLTESGFYITKSGRKYMSPPGRPLRDGPTDPKRVIKIVRMRELHNMNYREIAEKLGISRQAPFLLYKKWRTWAYPFIYKEE